MSWAIGLGATLTLCALILYHSALSVYRDARRRGLRAGWIVAAVMLTWPLGWLLYTLVAWRWPETQPRQPAPSLDLATWFRASWVGLFWFVASMFTVVGIAAAGALGLLGLTWPRGSVCLSWVVSGWLTTLSYESRVFERSWRMGARVISDRGRRDRPMGHVLRWRNVARVQ